MGLKKLLIKIRRSNYIKNILRFMFIVASKFPARNVIIFDSFLGKQYSDNPKAIYKYIKENYPEYKLYWAVDRRYISNFKEKQMNSLIRLSPKWIFLMATAKYWVVNSRLPQWLPKPKHTTYVQTWHGTPLKKIGIDISNVQMAGVNTDLYQREFVEESSKWDYLISPNAYSTEIFKKAFQFNKTIIESGYPRNDFLYTHRNNSNIHRIKMKLGLPTNKKVILYAPTWRDNSYYETGKYRFDLELDLNMLQVEVGNDYIVILRMHYLVAENIDISKYKSFAFDFSNHNDINELYVISDLLITDYSSVFFDFANLKRPMLFYVYDIEDYRDNLRGFYFDFESRAPGPLVKTTEEIIDEIKEIEQHDFVPSEKTKAFYDKFCYLEDGNASERVVKTILDKR